MQLQIMDSGGSLLEVPFICYHCGGRSDDLSTLESHIKTMHRKKLRKQNRDERSDFVEHMLRINEIVEVQIKEEPEFLVPLDLSKKEPVCQDNSIWIKEEPVEYDPLCIPSQDGHAPPTQLPKIRVANTEALKAPVLPQLLNAQNVGLQVPPPFPFGRYIDQYLKSRYPPIDPLSSRFPSAPAAFPHPSPPLLAIPSIIRPAPPPPPPRPRMPNHFPATPYLLAVPYICYHCGGRSGDLDTLKTHIETMHNPVMLHQQQRAAEAKRKLLQSLVESKIKLPKVPKIKKEKPDKIEKIRVEKTKIEKIKVDKLEKPEKIKIRIPKPEKKTKKQKNMENRRFQCPFCDFKATSFPGLILHAKAAHEKERAQKRLEAEQQLEAEKSLEAAKSESAENPESTETTNQNNCKKVVKKTYFYCLFCDYKSVQHPQLKKHMYAIHAKQKNLQCPYCHHRSAYSENMKWHIMSKHKYKCPHCDFRATTKAMLFKHTSNNCRVFFEEVDNVPVITEAISLQSGGEEKTSVPENSSASEKLNSENETEKTDSEALLENDQNDLSSVNNNIESPVVSSTGNLLCENGIEGDKTSEESSNSTDKEENTLQISKNSSNITISENQDLPVKKLECSENDSMCITADAS